MVIFATSDDPSADGLWESRPRTGNCDLDFVIVGSDFLSFSRKSMRALAAQPDHADKGMPSMPGAKLMQRKIGPAITIPFPQSASGFTNFRPNDMIANDSGDRSQQPTAHERKNRSQSAPNRSPAQREEPVERQVVVAFPRSSRRCTRVKGKIKTLGGAYCSDGPIDS